ncbi:c-type cytochrome [Arcobacter defluvii]|uniref:Ubiquinol cytochrome c oxidoreductase PetABC, membrane-bound cytochrome c subunit n=1 Tax=Arcobacter defluvii TaxID=873191 RepID=A0AAE7BIG7_9BACT|nr:c-type cytochrome [Arcobacter defluvii]QKF78627.1 ubiquinol cytochrome c oxidoreductase PetABC, membrane-bound cytochrome c subunit [Arcobacter defluvii]RXI34059.1 cytochrome C [Arcobacter defluvii]
MRELKILAVVVVLTLITYWGVEPYAHSVMHPHVAPADFTFSDTKEDVADVKGLQGNVANGEVLVTSNCTACHSIESKGFPQVMDNASSSAAYGVTPPDLGSAGKLYNADYLAAFIKDPAKASKTAHKFVDGKVHPMPQFNWMQPQEIADMVAYLQSIAPKEMTNKEVFTNACQRCHSIKYADMKGGSMAAFTPNDNIKHYMGKLPPDLSQMIRSRGHHYLETFVNDPQKLLEGTAMPRVGLTEESQAQVVAYLEEVGDSKKAQREELGPKFLIYLVIFAIFAFLWKASKWREVH